jgi:ubiquinone/menaquinone biosynthesis C-methylase UbiE
MGEDIWQQFYNQRAEEYARLVQNEDYQGNLIKALQGIHPLAGCRVAEFGAGTGRVTSVLAPHVGQVAAFDRAAAMLGVAQRSMREAGLANAYLALADNRRLPLPAGWADLAVEGWSFLHLKVWQPDSWQAETGQAIGEMCRVTRPGGSLVLIETLGTGQAEPVVAEAFQPFFSYLEQDWGFERTWVRTDYCFETQQAAHLALEEAFGEETLGALTHTPQGWVLPECTGVWWRRV